MAGGPTIVKKKAKLIEFGFLFNISDNTNH
jgi:hypothetical protein